MALLHCEHTRIAMCRFPSQNAAHLVTAYSTLSATSAPFRGTMPWYTASACSASATPRFADVMTCVQTYDPLTLQLPPQPTLLQRV